MTTAGRAVPTVARHSPLRSLRWRLTFFYIAFLAVILSFLGGILLVTVDRLLRDSAYTNFIDEARAAAATRNALFLNTVARKDSAGLCPTTFVYAFQTLLSDPLTQSPAAFQTVALIDRFTGVALAPASLAGTVPDGLTADALRSLRQRVAPRDNLAAWNVGVTQNAAVAYHATIGGVEGGGIVFAYDYRVVNSCALGRYTNYPAVLLLTRGFTATERTIAAFRLLLLGSIGLLFLLGLAVGIPLTGASLGPLARVTATARQLAGGDLHQRVRLRCRKDEVGELAQAFDEMAQRLEDAFASLHLSEERMRLFIDDASHELRTPITAIRGCLEVLQRNGYDDPRDRDRLVETARHETERMGRMVNDLLTLARLDVARPLDLVWTDLRQLAEETIVQARLLAGDRHVTLLGPPEECLALVDSDRIKQVLLALTDNALKYGRQDAQSQVTIALKPEGPLVKIEVTDNGPGIAPDDIPHLFDRFYRGKAVPGQGARPAGSGLGLAIVQAIIQAHGGTITVHTAPGTATSFAISLPVGGSPASDAAGLPTRPLATWSMDEMRDLDIVR